MVILRIAEERAVITVGLNGTTNERMINSIISKVLMITHGNANMLIQPPTQYSITISTNLIPKINYAIVSTVTVLIVIADKIKKQDIQSKKIQVQKPQGCVCRVCNCVNCQCGTKQTYCEHPNSLQTKQQIQVPQQFACTNCQCVNCKCGKLVEAKTCKCNSCQCINCNCESGCCQKAPLNQKIVEQVKPVVTLNNNKGANQQVTFGKKGVINTQKGFSQPKKVIKEKPTYTVIRQKK